MTWLIFHVLGLVLCLFAGAGWLFKEMFTHTLLIAEGYRLDVRLPGNNILNIHSCLGSPTPIKLEWLLGQWGATWQCLLTVPQAILKSSQLSTYKYLFFFKFFSHLSYYRYWAEFPVLYSRSLLVFPFKYSHVYMSIPNSQPVPPCYPSPLVTIISSFSKSVSLFLFCK